MSFGALQGTAAPGRRVGRWIVVDLVLLVAIAVVLAAVQLGRSVPRPTVSTVLPHTVRVGGRASPLPFPSRGSAAVEVINVGLLGSFHGEVVTPLASLTKLATALVVLRQHPLAPGDAGPSIRVSAGDVEIYREDLATDQSVVEVSAGERIDEREALEGLLVGSANNLAVLLARWDAGSTAAFVARMNVLARSLGLAHTHFVEPSGVDPADRGTALAMTRLGAAVLANRTIAAIVGMGEVILPVAGVVINYDYDVGHYGIVGIKTGSSSEAGGNFVFAAHERVHGRTVTVVGAVLKQKGASDLDAALAAGARLATGSVHGLRELTVLRAGTVAVTIRAPWRAALIVGRTTAPIRVFGRSGTTVTVRTVLRPLIADGREHTVAAGERVGTVTASYGGRDYTVPVLATASLSGPSRQWRLTRL